jgi:hypothetical protein
MKTTFNTQTNTTFTCGFSINSSVNSVKSHKSCSTVTCSANNSSHMFYGNVPMISNSLSTNRKFATMTDPSPFVSRGNVSVDYTNKDNTINFDSINPSETTFEDLNPIFKSDIKR